MCTKWLPLHEAANSNMMIQVKNTGCHFVTFRLTLLKLTLPTWSLETCSSFYYRSYIGHIYVCVIFAHAVLVNCCYKECSFIEFVKVLWGFIWSSDSLVWDSTFLHNADIIQKNIKICQIIEKVLQQTEYWKSNLNLA